MLKTVARFREPYEAHIAKGKLEAEGIPAIVLDEHTVQINWMYSQAIGGVKVQVPEEAFQRSREILTTDYEAELESTEEAHQEPSAEETCPKCGAISDTTREYSPWSLISSLLFMLPFFFRKRDKVCRYCGARWRSND